MSENKHLARVESAEHMATVLKEFRRLIIDYGTATVEDLKLLCNEPALPCDRERGWIDFPDVQIDKEYPNGVIDIAFPMPVPLGPKATPKETVDHPAHYQSETGLEAWDVIKAFTFDLKGIEAFDTGNVLKYMCRWKSKNGLEDLKKAARYLEHLIDHVENLKKEND